MVAGLWIFPARLTNDVFDYARVWGVCQPQ
jgi:hypothetical protein